LQLATGNRGNISCHMQLSRSKGAGNVAYGHEYTVLIGTYEISPSWSPRMFDLCGIVDLDHEDSPAAPRHPSDPCVYRHHIAHDRMCEPLRPKFLKMSKCEPAHVPSFLTFPRSLYKFARRAHLGFSLCGDMAIFSPVLLMTAQPHAVVRVSGHAQRNDSERLSTHCPPCRARPAGGSVVPHSQSCRGRRQGR
jgi:hypothetical protein